MAGINIITQTQISAFERCRRFYYLKNIRRLVWPVETEGNHNRQQGDDFHLLIRQLILGLSADSLIIPEGAEDVKRWLDVYLAKRPLGTPQIVFAEKDVSSLYTDILWTGKFDALTINDDQLTIYDWKTGSAKPDPEHYRTAPQTRLYRFLAKSCAARLLGAGLHAVPAENIKMVYWFPEHPEKTIRLPYSEEAYQQDMTWLKTLAAEMGSQNQDDYPKTAKTRQCEHCSYRTYCSPKTFFPDTFPDEADDPDEIFQTELFPPEAFSETDREDIIF